MRYKGYIEGIETIQRGYKHDKRGYRHKKDTIKNV